MNLFLIGLNAPKGTHTGARAALAEMRETYPLLDPATLGSWSTDFAFAAWMHTEAAAAHPRRYVHRRERGLVLYDGTPVDPDGHVATHDASALASAWPVLTDGAEGRFTAVRVDGDGGTAELVTDPFGQHQTFVHERGGVWWISNSARLLARVAASTVLDLVGMAQFIGGGTASDDRTLIEDVSVVPAAQRWTWSNGRWAQRTTYWDVAALASLPKRAFGAQQAAALADELGGTLAAVSANYGPYLCPITAGRDSRMLTGLTMARSIPATYFTAGEPDFSDVVFGTKIAERFGLPHERFGGVKDALEASWDEISLRVLRRNDGMVTLMHAENAAHPRERLERLAVQLYGIHGELARGKELTLGFALRRPNIDNAVTYLQRQAQRSPFLTREADAILRSHRDAGIRTVGAMGFAPVDVPLVNGLTQGGRRWVAAQERQIVDQSDVFAPFVTRAFVRAVLATPALERLAEHIPYQLLDHLSPELLAMPSNRPWPPQQIGALLLAKAWHAGVHVGQRALHRIGIEHAKKQDARHDVRTDALTRRLPVWRDRFLDDEGNVLWGVIDRKRFERITAPGIDRGEIARNVPSLYLVVTALAFAADFVEWQKGWSPAVTTTDQSSATAS